MLQIIGVTWLVAVGLGYLASRSDATYIRRF